jgi:hypothetical protein
MTHLHGPAPGARVRVWSRGAWGRPRGGARRLEGRRGGLRGTEGGSPEIEHGGPGSRARGGRGGGASYVCRRGAPGEEEGMRWWFAVRGPGRSGAREAVQSDPVGVSDVQIGPCGFCADEWVQGVVVSDQDVLWTEMGQSLN